MSKKYILFSLLFIAGAINITNVTAKVTPQSILNELEKTVLKARLNNTLSKENFLNMIDNTLSELEKLQKITNNDMEKILEKSPSGIAYLELNKNWENYIEKGFARAEEGEKDFIGLIQHALDYAHTEDSRKQKAALQNFKDNEKEQYNELVPLINEDNYLTASIEGLSRTQYYIKKSNKTPLTGSMNEAMADSMNEAIDRINIPKKNDLDNAPTFTTSTGLKKPRENAKHDLQNIAKIIGR
jgi:hypothetical protein